MCVSNAEFPASLEPRKIYRVLADDDAARRALLRIVDESGEDYLYPRDCFLPIALSPAVEEALRLAS
ncbi:MAG: hypothetical protein HY822_03460 [Acidobacteria bacterium]|nr:hypothetical protein [Acidobacteriota bacterium]